MPDDPSQPTNPDPSPAPGAATQAPVPGPASADSSPGLTTPTSDPEPDPGPLAIVSTWDLFIQDAAGHPIPGLNLWLTLDGKELGCTTDVDGLVAGLAHSTEPAKLEVEKTDGGRKLVGQVHPIPGTRQVRAGSPKVRVETHTRAHEVPPSAPAAIAPASSAPPPVAKKGVTLSEVWQYIQAHPRELLTWNPYKIMEDAAANPGTAAKPNTFVTPRVPALGQGNTIVTRNENGHPTVVVGMEDYDKNLKLGVNEEYRPAILASAKRVGLPPQVLASVVNAECARDRTGKWNKDCKSKVSSATGMGQFLDGTWLGLATTPGNYLFDKAKSLGYLEEKTVEKKNKQGKVISTKTTWAVKFFSKNDLLDLRKDPETMLTMIGQYGLTNLASLQKPQYRFNKETKKREIVDAALKIDGAGLNQVERARLMYLCHFLGAGDARKFIRNTMTENRSEKIFKAQGLPAKSIKTYLNINNNEYRKALRDWWNVYNSDKIDPNRIYVYTTKSEFDGKDLKNIIPTIGGTW